MCNHKTKTADKFINGEVYSDGMVKILFDYQMVSLPAPNDESTGEPRQYLPCCENCGTLCIVAVNVVSVMCDRCYAEYLQGYNEFQERVPTTADYPHS